MNETLERIIEDLYTKIQEKDKKISGLEQSIQWKDKELSSHDASFRELNNKIDDYKKQIKDLEEQLKKEQDKRSQLTSYIISNDPNMKRSINLPTNTSSW